MEQISVCVITLNEEDNIGRCLDSVQWAEDIVVVDSGSDDRTCEIAEEKGARVIHRDWPGMVKQKQYATENAQRDWVLNIDADEWLDEELQQSISNLDLEKLNKNTCFELTRKSRYLGQWLEHGSWYPDRILRLFNRKTMKWGGYDPHAHLEPAENRRAGTRDKVQDVSNSEPSTINHQRLSGHLLHIPYDDLSDHLDFINRYTSTMAQRKNEKGEKGTVFKAITHSAVKLFKEMILKFGFLDGKAGIIAAGMSTWYVFLKYAKLWELQQNNDHSAHLKEN